MRFRSALARPARILAAILAILAIAFTAYAQSSPRSAPPIPARLAALANLRPRANSTQPIVATPVLSVPPGSYSGPQTVTVTDTTPGATIYYATNGSSSTSPYTGPITISRSGTLVVSAAATGYLTNAIWGTYYITSVPDSFVYTVAGSSFVGYAGDGGLATQAMVNYPTGTVADNSGNLYIADTGNQVVRKVDASTGIITTVAGTSIAGYSGDGGPATSAQLDGPDSLAFDGSGNLYIGEKYNGLVRKVTMSTGVISTYAGNYRATTLGDGGPATSALLGSVVSLAIDANNNLYILGYYNGARVREVDASTQIITTVAGGGSTYPPVSGPATSVELSDPFGIAVDAAANIYIADSDDVIWKVTRSTGNISAFAGTFNSQGYSGDGGPAASATLYKPDGVAVDTKGNVFIADEFNGAIRKVDASTGTISTYAGNDPYCFSFAEDGSSASSSDICQAQGLSVDSAGNLYFVDGSDGGGTNRVKKITAPATPPASATADPVFSLSPGTYADPQTLTVSDSTPGASIYLFVYASTQYPYPINQYSIIPGGTASYHGPINLSGPETLIALAVAPGHSPSNTVSASYNVTLPSPTVISTVVTSPGLGNPQGIAMDTAGNIYIADESNNVVWKAAGGTISVFAGTGAPGDTGDNGPATSATLDQPLGVALDGNGNLFIADYLNNVVREVLAGNGNIVRFAGNGTFNGQPGDGGQATSASISGPHAVAVDSEGNVYVTDFGSVRKIDASTGIITTYAGGGLGGDGGPATSASVPFPIALAFDTSDNLYIGNNAIGDGRIRVVNAKTGIITTGAGNGNLGTSGDGLLATQAETYPNGIAVDGAGNLYIGSYYEIRKVDAATGIISSIAGIGYSGGGGDGGPASAANVCPALGLLLDSQSNIYFSNSCGAAVRKITFNAPAPAPTFDPPAGTYTSAQSVTISDTAPNATIYYTTDGSTPTNKSTQFNGAINVTANQTINAIAVSSGYAQSPVGSATYTFLATPTITWSAPAAITYGTALGSAQLNATASVPGAFVYLPAAGAVLPVGSQTLSVTFTPTDTADYATATDSVMLTVNPAMPAIALASSTNPSVVAQSVTFTATLSSPAGTPTGSVTFYDGTTSLGSGTLASGVATYSTTALAAGAHSITAQYSGDANFAPVTSTALNQTVNTFSIGPAPGAPTTASGAPGSIATYVLTVTPPAASAVTFSVTGLPAGFSSSFSPGSVAAGAGATQVELTINIPSQAAAAQVPATPGSASRLPLAFGLVLLPLLGLRKRIRGNRFLLLAALAIAGVVVSAGLSGCSHNFNSGSTGTGSPTPSGTYTLTVTATAGTQTQSTTLTLDVQ